MIKLPMHFRWSSQGLEKIPVAERLRQCPRFLQKIVEDAKAMIRPKRIWVFGSRSRHDQGALSDYDLAFEIPDENRKRWSVFVATQREKVKTLLPIDWVLFEEAGHDLKKEIVRKGTVIYEEKD